MRSLIRMSFVLFAALVLGIVLTASPSVQAATLTVNSLADVAANDGQCTLREAITAANIDLASGAAVGECIPGSGADTINFSVTGTIALTGVLPDLLTGLTISNTQVGNVTVQGNTSFRIFTLVNSAVVTINKLIMNQGGSGSSLGGVGGGIYMGDSATLTLTNSTVSNSIAASGGGGIWVNNSGTLNLTNSTISNNTATSGDGGGIYLNNSGTLNITSSTVNGNAATVGNGGGIYNGISGTINATNSTINGNMAGILGGGINNNGGTTAATATINSSTISGNTATNGGGGIYNQFTATLNNSLVALNTGTDGPDLLRSRNPWQSLLWHQQFDWQRRRQRSLSRWHQSTRLN